MNTPDAAKPVILITGGTGFVGSHLVELLQKSNAGEVHATTYGQAQSIVSELLPAEHIHALNLTDTAATVDLLRQLKPTQIYHLASIAAVGNSFDQAEQVLKNNTLLQLSFLQAVAEVEPTARVLAISSAEVYGLSEPGELPISESHPLRPINPYAVSKVTQDLLSYSFTVSHDLQLVRVRPFNHIGERQSPAFAIASFAQQIVAIERGQQSVLEVGNLSAVRDFTDVKDMVRAYQLLMEQGEVGAVYNVGSGVGIQMSDILAQLLRLSTQEIEIIEAADRLRALDIPEAVANPQKIKDLGWEPEIPLAQTLERILHYWRSLS